MAKKYRKRCSISLTRREMQIRTKMILTEGLQLKMDLTSVEKDAEESEPSYTAVIMRSGTATVKNSLAVSQKIKHGDAICHLE